MSESKEQFRWRIGKVAEDRRHRYPEVANSLAAHFDAAEAVYAEALRDVLRFFDGDDIGQEGIREFAAERGIDLNAKLD